MSDREPRQGGSFTVSDPDARPGDLPPIDFPTFVLSLATSAMVHLGLVPIPGAEGEAQGAPAAPDLPLAKQTIDTLEMIQRKTRGNLDDEEAKLLQSVLYELRMGYVKARDKGHG